MDTAQHKESFIQFLDTVRHSRPTLPCASVHCLTPDARAGGLHAPCQRDGRVLEDEVDAVA